MSTQHKKYKLELGKKVSFLDVDNYIIRFVDRGDMDDEDKEYSGYEAQGHVSNNSTSSVEDLVIDVSYYDKDGSFLGLNKTSVFEIDELNPGLSIPFKIDLYLPEDTERCALNVSGRLCKGFLNRLFATDSKSKKG